MVYTGKGLTCLKNSNALFYVRRASQCKTKRKEITQFVFFRCCANLLHGPFVKLEKRLEYKMSY